MRTPIRKKLLNQGRDVNPLLLYKSKNLTNQGSHNLPQFWHSRVVKSSNLTFRGYLAGTTPVLFVRSSLFVLCRYCFKHVRTVWLTIDFSASSFINEDGIRIVRCHASQSWTSTNRDIGKPRWGSFGFCRKEWKF